VRCALCERLERGERWTLALNLNQSLPGRCVLVVNRHIEDVAELCAEEWSDLQRQIRRTSDALAALFAPDRFNYAFLMNQDAHAHLHVVPRYQGPREWAGETWTDPHFGGLFGTEQRPGSPELLGRLADELRQRLVAG
jgi:diadenosine tetraphosphate (Ap4A) HIT family hydrolase